MQKDIKPALIDSCPREGPTTSACTTLAEAGNLPAPSTSVRSFASSCVKLPEI